MESRGKVPPLGPKCFQAFELVWEFQKSFFPIDFLHEDCRVNDVYWMIQIIPIIIVILFHDNASPHFTNPTRRTLE